MNLSLVSRSRLLCVSVLSFFLATDAFAVSTFHHSLTVKVDPAAASISVEDAIRVPESERDGSLTFSLHEGLSPVALTPGVRISVAPRAADEPSRTVPTTSYTVSFPAGLREFSLSYAGKIAHRLSDPAEEYSRGFRDTPGLIGDEGIYLAGASFWYPHFGEELVSFKLRALLPAGWDVVSQGERTFHSTTGDFTEALWEAAEPLDEIFFIGARFTEYERKFPSVRAMAFLRNPDPALAAKYLEATGRYVEMYTAMIGSYPYGKFALVENFWETGYGMPSFTLLGPKIIRFPFIISSSYPHEILHNWWGNSVLVDYSAGNWCEGLTAYMADHLIKEEAGGGAEYRRTTLQKYGDFASEHNDFPLSQFRERHSAVTEAVGYGKALMFFHMLRREYGDGAFLRSIQQFYRDNRFTRASYADLKAAFEAQTGRAVDTEFHQWVQRAGAPELRVSEVEAHPVERGFELSFRLEQVQPGLAYALTIPVAIHLQGRDRAIQTRVPMETKSQQIRLRVPARPQLVEVDPEFDLFRRLDRREVPPALSEGFGAKRLVVITPSGAPAEIRNAYEQLARAWTVQEAGRTYTIEKDSALGALPSDATVWVLGWENRFAAEALASARQYGVTLTGEGIRFDAEEYSRSNQSVTVASRRPGDPANTMVFLAGSSTGAVAGLTRKLPHYGKYSFLVFQGDEPSVIRQGIWPTLDSPMAVRVLQPDGSRPELLRGKLAPRPALSASLVAPLSEERLRSEVKWLSDPARGGRELGSPELDRVAERLADGFRGAGLQGGAANGDFFQRWSESLPPPKGELKLTNVVAVLPGKNPALPPLVLAAHYDHLGAGWPDAHPGDPGKVHPGADDNASGVAVLLELARALAADARSGKPPARSVVFAAFSGEEAGMLGSRYFLQNSARAVAMINLDTVGRLQGKKLTVFGASSAAEWGALLARAGRSADIALELPPTEVGASDHIPFLLAGIPALQLFSGAHADYHRPSDTADKIDFRGLLRIAEFTREVARDVTGRAESFTPQGPALSCPTCPKPGPSERKVYLGTVPDFTHSGPGVRIASVVEGSPAALAGLRAGDVLVAVNGSSIADLKAYADILRGLRPGDLVRVVLLRAETRLELELVVGART